MSRISVDALKALSKSKFELVLYLSQRAKDIGSGAKPLVEVNNKPGLQKPVLIAYEEISNGLIEKSELSGTVSRRLLNKNSCESVSSQFYGNEDRQNQMEERMRNSADAIFYGDDVDMSDHLSTSSQEKLGRKISSDAEGPELDCFNKDFASTLKTKKTKPVDKYNDAFTDDNEDSYDCKEQLSKRDSSDVELLATKNGATSEDETDVESPSSCDDAEDVVDEGSTSTDE